MNTEANTIRLEQNGSWELEPVTKRTDLYLFLRSLPLLFGEDCVLVLVQTYSDALKRFVLEREPADKPIIETLEDAIYLPMTNANLGRLFEIADGCAEPEVCMHLGVFRGREVLMEYGDACCGDDIPSVAGSVSEGRVRAFSEAVGFRYARYVECE